MANDSLPLFKSIDEMKAEAFARWKRQHDELHEERKSAGLATINLVHADGDPPTYTHEYQADFRDVTSALVDGGFDAETPFTALDSADAISGYTGEIIIAIALVAEPIVTGIMAAWLQKRVGRQIVVRIGDKRIETTIESPLTVEQLGELLRSFTMESTEEWISAGEAARLLKPSLGGEMMAQMSLCQRAYAGMVRSRAQRLIVAGRPSDNVKLPPFFWWAKGREALHQNWRTGDFDTWVKGDDLPRELRQRASEVHFEAFNVSFLRADVEKLIPADASAPPDPKSKPQAATQPGGRPPADWWEDCLIDLCFKHFQGKLPHKTQAEIAGAMQEWITAHGYEAADSTIKLRARKLMDAIKRDAAEN